MKTNIIFLDIDEVLNSHRTMVAYPKSSGKRFDPIAIEMINRLCEDCNAKIVVSSTWRGSPDILDMLFIGGIHSNHIFYWPEYHTSDDLRKSPYPCSYITPVGYHCMRGNDIRAWMEIFGHMVNRYICIDDGSDFYRDQPLVHIPYTEEGYSNGMQYQHYREAEDYLLGNIEKTKWQENA